MGTFDFNLPAHRAYEGLRFQEKLRILYVVPERTYPVSIDRYVVLLPLCEQRTYNMNSTSEPEPEPVSSSECGGVGNPLDTSDGLVYVFTFDGIFPGRPMFMFIDIDIDIEVGIVSNCAVCCGCENGRPFGCQSDDNSGVDVLRVFSNGLWCDPMPAYASEGAETEAETEA